MTLSYIERDIDLAAVCYILRRDRIRLFETFYCTVILHKAKKILFFNKSVAADITAFCVKWDRHPSTGHAKGNNMQVIV